MNAYQSLYHYLMHLPKSRFILRPKVAKLSKEADRQVSIKAQRMVLQEIHTFKQQVEVATKILQFGIDCQKGLAVTNLVRPSELMLSVCQEAAWAIYANIEQDATSCTNGVTIEFGHERIGEYLGH